MLKKMFQRKLIQRLSCRLIKKGSVENMGSVPSFMMKQKMLSISGLLILFAAVNLFANTEESDSLVTEAWKAWEENDQQQVERKFLAAIEEDRDNTRAYLGLCFLYSLQGKYEKSWMTYKNILQTEKDFYPYIYSAWLTSKIRMNLYDHETDIIDLLEELSKKADSSGILKAMANHELGDYYKMKRDFSKSNQFYKKVNAVKDWMLIGPFDNISGSGFDKVFPPEVEYDPSKVYEGKNGIPAKWFKVSVPANFQWINFLFHYAQTQSVFYANTFVYSPRKQTVQIRIGTSGSLKAFLNDELIVECFDENNNDLDTYIVETELQEGWNRLLIKCGFSEIGNCNFVARITDSRGEKVEGLKISAKSESYSHHPSAPLKPIENFAEAFFKQKLNENPDHLENYILLADTYLRNDKAIEAELVLRDAIKSSPNCALFYAHIQEAYIRGEKYDEIATTAEKIYSLDKNIPRAIGYKISDYLEKEEFEKAEELIMSLEKLLPESEDVYDYYLDLYREKDQVEKFIEINHKAYQRHPTNWTFVYYEAVMSIHNTRQFDRAIQIYNNYLNERYSAVTLSELANTYLEASDIEKWRETYDKIFELSPAPGYYYQMANTYFTLQDYENAEKMIKRAIDICPNSSYYWATLGNIYRVKNEIGKSRQAYREALSYNATNYDAREVLRELEEKKSIFHHFETIDTEDLIKDAPDANAHPDDDGVILLHDVRRVVYEQGASESSEEFLIRVFNKNGIDAFKEYLIDYNPYTEELILKKAVSIKSDGSEIKADVDENYLVFKSLEENDFIYMKWSIKNFYSGKLSNHFWDTFDFSHFYPQKIVRYTILVPEDFKFEYKTQNMPNEPIEKQTEDGIIYQWTLTDEPAIEYEYGMPVLDDIGKILYISSIDDWQFLVEWYTDLAQTKTRSSYEIKEQVEELFRDKESLSEEEKVGIIYDFITENIRYSSVPFRQSALIPQKARDVLVNRIGDCKDLTTLGIAMLEEVGIKAHFILVNTTDQGRNENMLPSISFNHAIAGVEVRSGLKYLDFSAYNYPMGSVPEKEIDAFALLIKSGVETPEYLVRGKFIPTNIFRKCTVDIRGDNSIVVQTSSTRTGTLSARTRHQFRHKSQKERERNLSEGLNNWYPNLKLTKFETENLDNLEPAVRHIYDYELPNHVTEAGQFKFFKLPWEFIYQARRELSYEERKFPYYQWTEVDTLVEEIEVNVPEGYEPVDLSPKVHFSSSVADYSISYTFTQGLLKVKKELISKKKVVSPEEYAEFKKFYNEFVQQDAKQILLRKKN